MKKIRTIIIALLLFALVIPFSVNSEETTSENSKINVYLFRGEGCAFCASALSFFDSIEEEYGQYYNLVTYEVWNDVENAELLNQVAEYLNTTIKGVPFIIIGDKTYPGFQEAWGEEIKQDIVNEYNKSVEERTDIVENVKNGVEPDKSSTNTIISIISILFIIGIIAFIVFARKEKDNYKEVKPNNEAVKNEKTMEEKIKESKKSNSTAKEKKTSTKDETKKNSTKKNNNATSKTKRKTSEKK